jgi:hypothetical protein
MKCWIRFEVAYDKIPQIDLFQVRSAHSSKKAAFATFSPVADYSCCQTILIFCKIILEMKTDL